MKPRLLFISDAAPFPPKDGKRQRNLALITAAQTCYQIDYLILGKLNEYEFAKSTANPNLRFFYLPCQSLKGISNKLGISFLPNRYNKGLITSFLTDNSYQKILCRYASTAKDLPELSNLTIDVDDDYEELMNSKIKSERSLIKKLRLWQIMKLNSIFYHKILQNASRLILVKPQQVKFQFDILPNLPFQSLLANTNKTYQEPTTTDILFIGKLSYMPNSDGITWFLKEVWPLFVKKNPSSKLTIVSVSPASEELTRCINKASGVSLKINVNDLNAEYQKHKICIIPVFHGGGSNVKLIEALFHNKTVVSSKYGIRGFERWEKLGLVSVAATVNDWVHQMENALNRTYQEKEFKEVHEYLSFDKWTNSLIKILNEA